MGFYLFGIRWKRCLGIRGACSAVSDRNGIEFDCCLHFLLLSDWHDWGEDLPTAEAQESAQFVCSGRGGGRGETLQLGRTQRPVPVAHWHRQRHSRQVRQTPTCWRENSKSLHLHTNLPSATICSFLEERKRLVMTWNWGQWALRDTALPLSYGDSGILLSMCHYGSPPESCPLEFKYRVQFPNEVWILKNYVLVRLLDVHW